ncbi:MAG: hypothetical protein CMB80_01290 [Flammeovirgaceae bacterium]|nr:hypothetical protein [Flammeovirgaceae bacterium]
MRDISLLLQNCDVSSVLDSLGIKYDRRTSKRGFELYFKCFTTNHQSDSDKLHMSIADSGPYKGMFNCWACGAKGNLIHMVRYLCHMNFSQAVVFLEEKYGSSKVAGIEGLRFRLRMFKEDDEIDQEITPMELPADYHPLVPGLGDRADAARRWLRDERHIGDAVIEEFKIGICSHPHIGIAIVIPIYFKGIIASIFYAQPFKGGLKRYPKNSPQGSILFNYDQCLESSKYIMMESILDVIKVQGITGIKCMACFSNMISGKQLKLLHPYSEHGVMPDLDGERGWDLVTRMVPVTGKSLWLYFPPIGNDPGDCTVAEIGTAINDRIRYCDYEFKQRIAARTTLNNNILRIYKK